MRVIDIKAGRAQGSSGVIKRRPLTCMSYGGTRAGKTRFAASFPRTLVLADASEGGWETIETMPAHAFYDPNVMPQVWGIEGPKEFNEAQRDAEALVKANKIESMCIDSLTFFSETYLNFLGKIVSSNGKGMDNRAIYGALSNYLRDLRIWAHSLKINVTWTALEKAPDMESGMPGGPALPGKAAAQFPAGCALLMYHRSVTLGQNTTWQAHTRPYGTFPAGGRDSGMLPAVILNPTYRALAYYLFNEGTAPDGDASTTPAPEDDVAVQIAEVTAPAPAPVPAPTRLKVAAPAPSSPRSANPAQR